MTELPMGWASCAIADTIELTIGGVWGAAAGGAEVDVDVIRVTEMKAFGRLATETAARRSVTMSQLGSRSLQSGDLILEKSGGGPNTPVGRVGMVTRVDRPAVCSNFMQLMRPNRDVVTPRFLLWQLVNVHVAGVTASLQTATTNIRNLKMKDYWEIQLSVPPLAEQERIVVAIEEAFSKLDAGEAGLRTVRQLLKRMRYAILAAAVTGRLVPQDPTEIPADKLLADPGVMAEGPDGGLPAGWAGCRLGVVTVCQEYGLSLKAHTERTEGDVPMLRMGNLRDGRVDPDGLKFVRRGNEGVGNRMLQDGDLLFNRTNSFELVGKSAVYRGKPADATFASYLIRVQTAEGVVPEWCASVINSHLGRAYIESVVVQQVGQANVNGTKLKQFPVPIPPHEEQLRILAELERQASFLDACERAVDVGLARSAALRRSVLKTAFEGKLVSQDPSDEPASRILERICDERAAAPKPARRKRRSA